jgi:hypothetical protein
MEMPQKNGGKKDGRIRLSPREALTAFVFVSWSRCHYRRKIVCGLKTHRARGPAMKRKRPADESPPLRKSAPSWLATGRKNDQSESYHRRPNAQAVAMWHREARSLTGEFSRTGHWKYFRALLAHVIGMRERMMGDRA